jgi:hypothetical protein
MTPNEKKLSIALLSEKLQNLSGKKVILESDENKKIILYTTYAPGSTFSEHEKTYCNANIFWVNYQFVSVKFEKSLDEVFVDLDVIDNGESFEYVYNIFPENKEKVRQEFENVKKLRSSITLLQLAKYSKDITKSKGFLYVEGIKQNEIIEIGEYFEDIEEERPGQNLEEFIGFLSFSEFVDFLRSKPHS